jgi:surfactin synthase thioesterase subunit
MVRQWRECLAPSVQLCAVELPGRWGRRAEPPCGDLLTLAQAIAAQLMELVKLPVAIFGHSYGPLLGYEVAHALRATYGVTVRHLFAAAQRAPHLSRDGAPRHGLSDPELATVVNRRYGTIPEMGAALTRGRPHRSCRLCGRTCGDRHLQHRLRPPSEGRSL